MVVNKYRLEIFNNKCMPSGQPRPALFECGPPTCMVFATLVAEGAKDSEDCPCLDDLNSKKLSEYMSRFHFEL